MKSIDNKQNIVRADDAEMMVNCAGQQLLFTNHVAEALDAMVEKLQPSSVFVLVDVNTASFVLPRLQCESKAVASACVITVKAGEMFKSVDSLVMIWKALGDNGATRRSLLINVGGGIVTDMGAFAAATFKRGISFINVPTTLLAAVDASVGGKTGINFNGLKNEVGMFREADRVIISTTFFRTLTSQELLSGYAEMIKHGFISSKKMTKRLLAYDIRNYDADTLLDLIKDSVSVKVKYVSEDLHDNGVRRMLNFGHTVAHAFESFGMMRRTPVSHGYAVAFGMLCALILSRMKFGFPSEDMHTYAAYVAEHYGAFEISCNDYPRLLELMHHDKKNSTSNVISCALLSDYGKPQINVAVTDDEMTAALDIYRDLLHLP